MNRWKLGTGAVCVAAIASAAMGGCGSSSTSESGAGASSSASHASSTSASVSSSGSTGGSTASSTSTSSGSGSTSVSTSSTSSGTGGASTGDSGVTCLAASGFAAAFSIMDSSFCAVAIYSSPEPLANGATWGAHNGPLTMVSDTTGGGVTLERWTAPSGTTGALTKQTTHVAAGVPTGAYLNTLANDMPFFGWTMVSWTGPGTATTGSIAAIANGAVATSYTVNGIYSVGGVAAPGGLGRLLYTGLSPLGAPTTDTNGLYEADACSSPMNELGAGTGCTPSAVVSAYAENSGPLALDKNGDAFTVLADSTSNMQIARGFLGADVARGAPATAGSQLFQIGGFAGSLAAITPTATKPGVLVFQPFDGTSFDGLDVIEQLFTAGVADAGTAVAPMGSTSTMLHITTPSNSGLTLLTDETDRLWVGYSDTATTTQWVVLARTP